MARSGELRAALRSPTGLIALITLIGLSVLSIIAPMIWGKQAKQLDLAHLMEGGSAAHPFGTDHLGHDILARVLVATRPSLVLAVLAILVAALIGVPLGALPTVLGRRTRRFVNALIDFSVAFPALLLAIFTAVVLGTGMTAVVLAIGIASAPAFARLTQTLAASVAGSDYVAAARLAGVRRFRLLWRHVLPNVAEPIILNVTIAVGAALVAIAGLSFLGLGVQPPAYDWGRLLQDGVSRIYITPGAALGPAAAIVVAGLAFNGLGEALARAVGTRPTSAPKRRRTGETEVDLDSGDGSVVTGGRSAVEPVLNVEGLVVGFPTPAGSITPVRGVSFSVAPGEMVGIVGESGSGKSLTALSVAQLVAASGEVSARKLEFDGHDLFRLPEGQRRRLLGTSLAMVFQDPVTCLNPALRIGVQLAEVTEVHGGVRRREAIARAVDRLRRVRIPSPDRRVRQYPHELSGGMRQRVMIAMGLMGQPKLIIADEPTSALDVTVQQQILRLLRGVNADTGAAAILISHDIAVVTELCDRVLVMYAGRIVEDLSVAALVTGAAHPYTRALVASIPDMATDRDRPLATIAGGPPEPHEFPVGCAFAARCPIATRQCEEARPELEKIGTDRLVACWHPHIAQTSPADSEIGIQ